MNAKSRGGGSLKRLVHCNVECKLPSARGSCVKRDPNFRNVNISKRCQFRRPKDKYSFMSQSLSGCFELIFIEVYNYAN